MALRISRRPYTLHQSGGCWASVRRCHWRAHRLPGCGQSSVNHSAPAQPEGRPWHSLGLCFILLVSTMVRLKMWWCWRRKDIAAPDSRLSCVTRTRALGSKTLYRARAIKSTVTVWWKSLRWTHCSTVILSHSASAPVAAPVQPMLVPVDRQNCTSDSALVLNTMDADYASTELYSSPQSDTNSFSVKSLLSMSADTANNSTYNLDFQQPALNYAMSYGGYAQPAEGSAAGGICSSYGSSPSYNYVTPGSTSRCQGTETTLGYTPSCAYASGPSLPPPPPYNDPYQEKSTSSKEFGTETSQQLAASVTLHEGSKACTKLEPKGRIWRRLACKSGKISLCRTHSLASPHRFIKASYPVQIES